MRVILDKNTIKTLKIGDSVSLEKSLSDILNGLPSPEIHLSWPAFLEYIEESPTYENFPKFNPENALYNLITQLLPLENEKEYLIEVYDYVFAECLTHVKALPQIQSDFLIERIKKKRSQIQGNNFQNQFFLPFLDTIQDRLVQNPYEVMHDLVLYLAWDRVCINFAGVFEFTGSDPSKMSKGLEVVKTCLAESFQHISDQKRTIPGFYRLVEAFFAFNMRDENLNMHSEKDWHVLCQSFNSLYSREELIDIPYIDLGMECNESTNSPPESFLILTMDSVESVKSSYALTDCIVEKLKQESLFWKYQLVKNELSIVNLEGHRFCLLKTS